MSTMKYKNIDQFIAIPEKLKEKTMIKIMLYRTF